MLLNLERAQKIMAENKLDGLLASTAENVTYTTGYSNWPIYTFKDIEAYGALSRSGEIALVVSIDAVDYLAQCPAGTSRIYTYGTFHVGRKAEVKLADAPARIVELRESLIHHPRAVDALKQALHDMQLLGGRIGFDERGMPPQRWRALLETLAGTSVSEAGELFRTIRMIKTEEEIRLLRNAVRAVESGIQTAFANARPGMSEADLQRMIRVVTVLAGANPGHCETSAGVRGAGCFPSSEEYVLQPGDVIRSDCGARYGWYWADTGRTAVIGEPPAELATYFQALHRGIETMLNMIKPGVSAAQLAKTTIASVRDNGIPQYQRHHVGHGIGLEMYEPPILAGAEGSRDIHRLGGENVILEDGMVINIELPYYELGLGGLQIEDTLVVRERGNEVLTTADRGLLKVAL
jgi:Xaa-Pro aminopeptidase